MSQPWHRFVFITGTSLKSSRRNIELMVRPGALKTVLTKQTINTTETMILQDPHLTETTCFIAKHLDRESAHSSFNWTQSVSCVCSIDSSFSLTTTKKNIPVEVWQYLIEQVANNMGYLNNVITADEMWIYCYDPTFKQQTSELVPWSSSWSLKLHASKLKMKCMVITFFDWKGMAYTHAVPDWRLDATVGVLVSRP